MKKGKIVLQLTLSDLERNKLKTKIEEASKKLEEFKPKNKTEFKKVEKALLQLAMLKGLSESE